MILSLVKVPPWTAVVAICLVIALYHWRVKTDQREPPLAPPPWPIIGHLYHLFKHGHYLGSILRDKMRSPVYAFDVLIQRFYVINDPHLVSLLQREEKKQKNKETRTVSNRTLKLFIIHQNMYGNSNDTMKKMIQYDKDRMPIEPCHREDMEHMLHKTLAPGRAMAQLYQRNMAVIADEVGKVSMGGPQRVALLDWLKTVFLLSGAAALYGPDNPFAASKDVVQAFWDWNSGLSKLMFNALPAFTPPDAIRGREKVVDELKNFLIRNGEAQERDEYSELVRNRVRINKQYALSDDGHARSELGMMFGMSGSATAVMFWLIAHILCDQTLHAKILAEMRDAIVVQKTDKHGQGEDSSAPLQAHLDSKALKRSCPLLLSTYYETLRTVSATVVTRRAERDFVLDDRYLLKKNGILWIPAYSTHTDPAIWGPDAHEVQPERFLPSASSSTKKQPPPSTLRTFGGGAEICPGRHLAIDLILSLTSLVLYSFDVTSGGSQGRFALPEMDIAGAVAMIWPVGDMNVVLHPREDVRRMVWKFD